MWLAALWDMATGTFFADQDWEHPTEEDGTKSSCWEAAVQQEAQICLLGLQNMHSYYTAKLAQSPESSVPWGEAFHFRMAVMMEWCRRVVDGRMPHGALLAHTPLTGQTVVTNKDYSVPAAGVDWQEHGRQGVAALRAILLHMGFYPQMADSVRDRPPPAVVSLADRNRAKKETGFPAVEWRQLTTIRGVEFWLDDEAMLREYTWSVVKGGPAVAEVQCPVRSGELRPGEYNVTYYQQAKGHWFWAMYRDESAGNITVKWVRGKCPPGSSRWQHKNSHK